ncbi:hypothetical protein JHW43_006097 [Diplocarpon mali]|nr:hypothetical protein JHW43_006097 [Diplocarpon mali]
MDGLGGGLGEEAIRISGDALGDGRSKTVTLAGGALEIFAIFATWLYTKKICRGHFTGSGAVRNTVPGLVKPTEAIRLTNENPLRLLLLRQLRMDAGTAATANVPRTDDLVAGHKSVFSVESTDVGPKALGAAICLGGYNVMHFYYGKVTTTHATCDHFSRQMSSDHFTSVGFRDPLRGSQYKRWLLQSAKQPQVKRAMFAAAPKRKPTL